MIPSKELDVCEIYPQWLSHNSNGRFAVVTGDGEYIIYTAMALRNKAFGSALQFIWNKNDASAYAVRESGVRPVRVVGVRSGGPAPSFWN